MSYGQDQSIGLKQTTRIAVWGINKEEKFLKVKGKISISTKRQIIENMRNLVLILLRVLLLGTGCNCST